MRSCDAGALRRRRGNGAARRARPRERWVRKAARFMYVHKGEREGAGREIILTVVELSRCLVTFCLYATPVVRQRPGAESRPGAFSEDPWTLPVVGLRDGLVCLIG